MFLDVFFAVIEVFRGKDIINQKIVCKKSTNVLKCLLCCDRGVLGTLVAMGSPPSLASLSFMHCTVNLNFFRNVDVTPAVLVREKF